MCRKHCACKAAFLLSLICACTGLYVLHSLSWIPLERKPPVDSIIEGSTHLREIRRCRGGCAEGTPTRHRPPPGSAARRRSPRRRLRHISAMSATHTWQKMVPHQQHTHDTRSSVKRGRWLVGACVLNIDKKPSRYAALPKEHCPALEAHKCIDVIQYVHLKGEMLIVPQQAPRFACMEGTPRQVCTCDTI